MNEKIIRWHCIICGINQMVKIDKFAPKKAFDNAQKYVMFCRNCSDIKHLRIKKEHETNSNNKRQQA